ncbi:MAG: exodeoxyribonuclease III [Myxococcales bacterium]|jgi:exodeoxyribonuclease-3|nr:exodeoxyribonuclease III [Myxococcales bacterium]
MRIATWNVNSLKARLEKLAWWLERARPDVVLLQETKLADDAAPHAEVERLGYTMVHHGEGRWNGVAILSKTPITEVVTNFGEPLAEPLPEARMVSALTGGVRVVSVYAPNGRSLGSPFYRAKLAWFERLARWLEETRAGDQALAVGGDFNVAPEDRDVWNPAACHGGTHVSAEERAAVARLRSLGLVDAYRLRHDEPERYTWWDYRAGDFYKNVGMRIDHVLVTASVAARVVASEIDREARKGKPIPSDHAPLTVDLDEPGAPYDAGWTAAAERIAARRAAKPKRAPEA